MAIVNGNTYAKTNSAFSARARLSEGESITVFTSVKSPQETIFSGQNSLSADGQFAQSPITTLTASGLASELTLNSLMGLYVKSISGIKAVADLGWKVVVNGIQVNPFDYRLKNGDRVEWFYGGPGTHPY